MKILIIVVALALGGLAVFGYSEYRCKQKTQAIQAELETARKNWQDLHSRFKAMEADFSRLEVWKAFIQVQRDLDAIEESINQLNFGNAIGLINGLADRIRSGRLDGQLQSSELVSALDQAKQALMEKDEHAARVSLMRFNREIFEKISGVSPLDLEQPQSVAPPAELAPQTQSSPAEPSQQ
jgi:hypothetical protein